MFQHLNNIKACPDCGNKTIQDQSISNQHCNGHWNEKIHFTCGYEIKFSPNFMNTQVTGECVYSKNYKEKTDKRNKLLSNVRAAITLSDVDDDYKKKLMNALQYV